MRSGVSRVNMLKTVLFGFMDTGYASQEQYPLYFTLALGVFYNILEELEYQGCLLTVRDISASISFMKRCFIKMPLFHTEQRRPAMNWEP